MKVVEVHKETSCRTETGVALGNFDGLHIGHMALVNTMLSESRLNGYSSSVYTFFKHPEHLLRKKLISPIIMTTSQKVKMLSMSGVDTLYLDEFDEDFSRMTPQEFVKDILVDKLCTRLVVVGFNYRFGFKGTGDTELLKKLGNEFGFRVIVVPPVKVDNEIVSSTLIRKYIQKGDMERSFQLLGHHFSVLGTVGRGRQLGGKMGFPTANINPEPYLIIPSPGVYITRTLISGKWFNSITNVGYVPTLKQEEKPVIETHILDFEKDVYGEEIEIFFIKKIRNEKRFDTKEQLVEQIKKDLECIRTFVKN